MKRTKISDEEAREAMGGITPQNIIYHVKAGHFERAEPGYLWADSVIKYWHSSADAGDLDKWETEYRKAKAQLAKMELSVKRGRLIPLKDLMADYITAATYFRNSFDELCVRIPERLAGLQPVEVAKVLREEIGKILTPTFKQLEPPKEIEIPEDEPRDTLFVLDESSR